MVRPKEKDIIAGKAPELCDWIESLWSSVVWRLTVYLFEDPTQNLRNPLYLQQTPGFVGKASSTSNIATTFKEPWVMANCVKSLKANGLYEGTMTIWQFMPCAKEWHGMPLFPDTVSWSQYDACAGLWS